MVILGEAKAVVDIGSAMGWAPQPQLSPRLLLLKAAEIAPACCSRGPKNHGLCNGAWGTLAAQLSPLLLLLAGAKAAGAQRLSKVAPSGWNYGGKQRRGQTRSFSQAVQRGCAELSLQSSQKLNIGKPVAAREQLWQATLTLALPDEFRKGSQLVLFSE